MLTKYHIKKVAINVIDNERIILFSPSIQLPLNKKRKVDNKKPRFLNSNAYRIIKKMKADVSIILYLKKFFKSISPFFWDVSFSNLNRMNKEKTIPNTERTFGKVDGQIGFLFKIGGSKPSIKKNAVYPYTTKMEIKTNAIHLSNDII